MEKAKPKGEKQMETGVVGNDLTTLKIHLTSSWSSTTLPDCDCCGLVVFLFVCFLRNYQILFSSLALKVTSLKGVTTQMCGEGDSCGKLRPLEKLTGC